MVFVCDTISTSQTGKTPIIAVMIFGFDFLCAFVGSIKKNVTAIRIQKKVLFVETYTKSDWKLEKEALRDIKITIFRGSIIKNEKTHDIFCVA